MVHRAEYLFSQGRVTAERVKETPEAFLFASLVPL